MGTPFVRLEPLLFVALALAIGVYGLSAPVVGAAALGVLLLVVAASGRRHRYAMAFLVVSVALLAGCVARRQVRAHEAKRWELVTRLGAPRRCEGDGTVVTSPVVHRSAEGASVRLVVDAQELTCDATAEGQRITDDLGTIRVQIHGHGADAETARRGDRLHFIADLAAPTRFLFAELPEPRWSEAARGVLLSGGALDVLRTGRGVTPGGLVDALRNGVRARISATFSADTDGFARALVLGENDLAPDDDRAFRDAGLSHLLAVSGMHIVLVVAGLVRALAWLFARFVPLAARYDTQKLAAACGIPLTILYADFAGGSGSAWRAAVTASLAFLMTALGRRAPALRHLAAAPLLLSLGNPLVVTDVSFQLSAAATFGLLVFARPMTELLKRIVPAQGLAGLAEPLATTLAATIPTVPLLARLGGRLPLLAVPLNGIAVPIGELAALPICLVHLLAGPVPPLEQGLATAGGGALRLLVPLARFGADAPGWNVPPPTPLQGAALALAALLAVARFAAPTPDAPAALNAGQKRALTAGIVALFAVVAGAEIALRGAIPVGGRAELVVTHLDVGQGDATLVTLPSGKLLLVDGGGFVGSPVDPGVPIAALLRARRRDRVDVVALSHPHPDHFGGLTTATASVAVGRFWSVTEASTEVPPVAALRKHLEMRGARSLGPRQLCGDHPLGDGVVLRILAPCPGVHDGWSTNDNSLVFQVISPYGRALFVGDAERDAEEALVASYGSSLASDLLKVGHHGSRTSSAAPFLDAVKPRLAVASSGLRNRFGHPHPRTVTRFSEEGIPLLVTSRTGAVTVRFTAEGLRVTTAREGLLSD